MNLALYIRVSTDEQVDKFGPQIQRRLCTEWARQNGHTILLEEFDDGYTGANLKRPGLTRLRAMYKAQQIDGILSLCADRISRKCEDLLRVNSEIRVKKDMRLFFAKETYDNSSASQMFLQIRASFAEFEYNQIVERTQDGRLERVRDKGKSQTGRCPMGFDYNKGVGTLTINPEAAAIVQKIWQLRATGMPVFAITRQLRREGVRPRFAKHSIWQHSATATILAATCYHPQGPDYAIVRQRAGGEIFEYRVPPIISRELWEKVQSVDRKSGVGRPTRRYLLKNILFCGQCGLHMQGSTKNNGHGGEYRAYRCHGYLSPKPERCACRNKGNGPAIDAQVWKLVADTFSDAGLLRAELDKYFTGVRAKQKNSGSQITQLEKHLADVKRRERSAFNNANDLEGDERKEFLEEYRKQRAERIRAEQDLSELRQASGDDHPAMKEVEAVVALMKRGISGLKDQEGRMEFLGRNVQRVEFDGVKIVVKARFFGVSKLHSESRSTGKYRHQPKANNPIDEQSGYEIILPLTARYIPPSEKKAA